MDGPKRSGTPKPTALKILEGNPGQRPINRNEPRPAPGAPEPPAGLCREGRAEWRRVVPELDRLGLLTRVDRATLVGYVETWARWWALAREAQGAPAVVAGASGSPVKNPIYTAVTEASTELRRYITELGLSPVARTRLSVPEPSSDDLGRLLA